MRHVIWLAAYFAIANGAYGLGEVFIKLRNCQVRKVNTTLESIDIKKAISTTVVKEWQISLTYEVDNKTDHTLYLARAPISIEVFADKSIVSFRLMAVKDFKVTDNLVALKKQTSMTLPLEVTTESKPLLVKITVPYSLERNFSDIVWLEATETQCRFRM